MPQCKDKSVKGTWEVQEASAVGPHTGWHPYSAVVTERLEKAFATDGKQECQIIVEGKLHTVNFNDWKVKGPGGMSQNVRRLNDADAQVEQSKRTFTDPFADHSNDLERSPSTVGSALEATKSSGHFGIALHSCSGHQKAILQSTIQAHEESIYTISTHLSGEQIMTGCKDGSVKLWEVATGYVVREFDRHPGQVISVALSKSRPLAATGCDDDNVRLFNIGEVDPVAVLEGHVHKVYSAVFTNDSRQLISGAMDGLMKIWDVNTHRQVRNIEAHEDPIFACAVGPRSNWLVLTASDDCTCGVHDLRVQENSMVQVLNGHKKTLWGADVRFDEQQYVTCGMDGLVLVWDARNPSEPMLRKIGCHSCPVHWVEFMPDGDGILSSARDRTWRLSSATTGDTSVTVKAHEGNVFRVSYNAVTDRVITCSSDRTVKIWQLVDGGED